MQREAKFEKINRWFFPAYVLLCLGAAVYYGVRRDMYHFPLSLLAAAMPVLMALFFRVLRLRRSAQMDFMILLFILLAFPCGSVLEFFQLIPHYDKICHTLSGAFVSMLALALFLTICPEGRLTRRNRLLAVLFVFFASMAVAGLWEICEYFVNLITGRDVQRVLATGVGDTMQDMIVCMIGTLISLPFVGRACEGKPSALTSPADAFIELNMK
mgnify:CR=1 FL=1